MCVEKEEMLQNGVLFLWIFKLFLKNQRLPTFSFSICPTVYAFGTLLEIKGSYINESYVNYCIHF